MNNKGICVTRCQQRSYQRPAVSINFQGKSSDKKFILCEYQPYNLGEFVLLSSQVLHDFWRGCLKHSSAYFKTIYLYIVAKRVFKTYFIAWDRCIISTTVICHFPFSDKTVMRILIVLSGNQDCAISKIGSAICIAIKQRYILPMCFYSYMYICQVILLSIIEF